MYSHILSASLVYTQCWQFFMCGNGDFLALLKRLKCMCNFFTMSILISEKM